MSGFIINLGTLPAGSASLEVGATALDLELSPEEWPEAIRADLDLDRTGDLVAVRGRIQARARLECVRCLEIFDLPVTVSMTVVADRAGAARGHEEELEANDYMKFHDGRQLDLRTEAREALLLELPITPHCREECRGLCPRCGANLNEGPCGCAH
jgi:uncharacterized protein